MEVLLLTTIDAGVCLENGPERAAVCVHTCLICAQKRMI